jgi:hypothetical protein
MWNILAGSGKYFSKIKEVKDAKDHLAWVSWR